MLQKRRKMKSRDVCNQLTMTLALAISDFVGDFLVLSKNNQAKRQKKKKDTTSPVKCMTLRRIEGKGDGRAREEEKIELTAKSRTRTHLSAN